MKPLMPKVIFLLCFFSFFIQRGAFAQNITGIWRGYFITDQSDQYKLELQVQQSNTDRTTGVTYSYLSTIFYGKATTTGFFNKGTKTALVQEIKTVELKMAGGSVACIMKYSLKYSRSGNEEFLEGTYTSKYEKTSEGQGSRQGGDCGGGKVFLRKVVTSDFYVEPFLRSKPVVRKPMNTAPPKSNSVTKQPEVKTPPVVKKPPTNTAKPPVTNKTTTAKPKVDTVKKVVPPPVVKIEPKKITPPAEIKLPQTTRSRKNELVQT
ncbi:MAG TPA: hypothetical protein VM888_12100, partial [Chitinophagaceae bacterium]|nr:hypothetical protein [Chitinophagaceae bacterium]